MRHAFASRALWFFSQSFLFFIACSHPVKPIHDPAPQVQPQPFTVERETLRTAIAIHGLMISLTRTDANLSETQAKAATVARIAVLRSTGSYLKTRLSEEEYRLCDTIEEKLLRTLLGDRSSRAEQEDGDASSKANTRTNYESP